ncbi:hypothetical protein LC040_05870 [Bacillus tianshenii]|nr:hypothetical protein LC040_05870 [Bacillus tianshenii]
MIIQTPLNAEKFIKKEVPYKVRAQFIPLIHKAYDLAYKALEEYPFLGWKIGEYHIGYLKHIAVQYVLKNGVDRGELPFNYTIEYNSNKTYPFLQLHTENAKITVSQTTTPNKIARPAFFRKKLQLANQLYWDLWEEEEVNTKLEPKYLLLTHGYGNREPAFINLGMPGKNNWIDRINILEEPRLIKLENEDRAKEEKITSEKLVDFKEFLQGVRRSEE